MKKILVIEDEETCWKIINFFLTNTGQYEVKIESDGKRALAAVREFKPDLILLDIVMPDTDGIEISNQLKTDNNFQEIPVVLMTAIVTQEEVDLRGGILYGRPCIAKPIVNDNLLACIENNLS
ncbi:MAG: response regulator [Desulfobacterales bacterium]|nr:response regulator [Desulfobacterales bacterium]